MENRPCFLTSYSILCLNSGKNTRTGAPQKRNVLSLQFADGTMTAETNRHRREYKGALL